MPGVFVGDVFAARDDRGVFVKPWTLAVGPPIGKIDEVFFSISNRGVVRGMHAQMGDAAGRRLVYVTSGSARDFVVDLRVGSPTFGEVVETVLEPGSCAVLVAPGCAHGFESLQENTTMVYLQEGAHDPTLDIGVHWTSCGFVPRVNPPIVSARDDSLPHISHFDPPFLWTAS